MTDEKPSAKLSLLPHLKHIPLFQENSRASYPLTQSPYFTTWTQVNPVISPQHGMLIFGIRFIGPEHVQLGIWTLFNGSVENVLCISYLKHFSCGALCVKHYLPTLIQNSQILSCKITKNKCYKSAIVNGIIGKLTFLDFTMPSRHSKELLPALSHNMRHILGT